MLNKFRAATEPKLRKPEATPNREIGEPKFSPRNPETHVEPLKGTRNNHENEE